MRQLDVARSGGSNDLNWAAAVNLRCVCWVHLSSTVEGDRGWRDRKHQRQQPPRRTSTVIDTRLSDAMCRAFQLSGATATYNWCPAQQTTALVRGLPDGVTWPKTAADAFGVRQMSALAGATLPLGPADSFRHEMTVPRAASAVEPGHTPPHELM
jgi:hypothetical protein